MLSKTPKTSLPLIERARSSEISVSQQALGDLSVIYAPYIYSISLRYIANLSDAQDCSQEFIANIVLTGKLTANYSNEKGEFRKYLFAAVKNACLKKFRKASTEISYDSKLYSPRENSNDDPVLNEDLIWAQTLLAQAVEQTRNRLVEGGKRDIWELYFDQVIRPKLFRIRETSIDELVKKHRLSKQQIRNKIQNGRRALMNMLREVVAEIDQAITISDSRTEELFRLLTSPGAFDGVDCGLMEKFGLSEISNAIFLSKGPLGDLVDLDDEFATEDTSHIEWPQLLMTPLAAVTESSKSEETIGQLLHSPNTAIDLLAKIKSIAKFWIENNDHSNVEQLINGNKQLGLHLYCAAIAAGIVHRRESASSLDTTQLLYNLQKMKSSPMFDQRSKHLIVTAISVIRDWK